MNILYITQIDPRETNRGSAQRTHLIWEALKECGTVYTFIPTSRKTRDESIDGERIHKGCLDSPNICAFLLDRTLLRLTGVARWPFRSMAFIEKRIGWGNVKFDFVVTRYLAPIALTSSWKIAPTLVDVDDLPEETCCGRIRKYIVRIWSKILLRKAVGAWIANVSHGNYVGRCCNKVERLDNVALAARSDYRVNGKQLLQLMTVGLMNYRPNYEGVDWFLENIWTYFHKQHPDFTYHVAGGGLPSRYQQAWAKVPGVYVRGYVDDLDSLYESSFAVVAPIFTGSGTCIKSIEAAMRGRVLLATPFALRGLSQEDVVKLSMNAFSSANEFCFYVDKAIRLSERDRIMLQNRIQEHAKSINAISRFNGQVRSLIEKCE